MGIQQVCGNIKQGKAKSAPLFVRSRLGPVSNLNIRGIAWIWNPGLIFDK